MVPVGTVPGVSRLPAWPAPSLALCMCSFAALALLVAGLVGATPAGTETWVGPVPLGLWILPALGILIAFSRQPKVGPAPGLKFWVPLTACLTLGLFGWLHAGLPLEAAIALLVVAAAEEGVFRVGIISLFAPPLVARAGSRALLSVVVVSAVVFAAMPGHTAQSVGGVATAFVFALTLSLVTAMVQRIGPAIAVHAACNLVTIAALLSVGALWLRPVVVIGAFVALYLAYRRSDAARPRDVTPAPKSLTHPATVPENVTA